MAQWYSAWINEKKAIRTEKLPESIPEGSIITIIPNKYKCKSGQPDYKFTFDPPQISVAELNAVNNDDWVDGKTKKVQ